MKLIQVNEEFTKEVKDKIVIPMDPVLATDELENKEEKDAKRKKLSPLKKSAEILIKNTAPDEELIDPMLKESFEDNTSEGFKVNGQEVSYRGHKFKLVDNSDAKNGIAKDSYILIDPANNYKLVDMAAGPIDWAIEDGDVQKACDDYLVKLQNAWIVKEDFEVKGKDLTKNAAWNTGHLNLDAKTPDAPEDESGAGGYWDLAGEIANLICGYVGDGLGKKYDALQDALYKVLKYDLNSALKSVISNKWFNEALTEEIDEQSLQDRGIAGMLNNLIKDEWEAVDGYQSAIATLDSMEGDFSKVKDILTDILGEEMIHIGQLQEAMKSFEPAVDKIEDGAKEGAEQASEVLNKDNEEELELN